MLQIVLCGAKNPTVLVQSVRGLRNRYRQFVKGGRKLPPEFLGEYVEKVEPEELEEYRTSQYYLNVPKDPSSPPPHLTSDQLDKNQKPVSINLKRQFPEFAPKLAMFPEMRDSLVESLERREMMRRRKVIDIPEFYVGSWMAVTQADPHAPGKSNRFVGICINRVNYGLFTAFSLRNIVDQVAIEVDYHLYSLKVQKIEVLKLQRSVDRNMLYLRDAPYEYSTVPWDMVALPHDPSTPVPVITEKVKLFDPPWHNKWYLHGYRGIDETSLYSSLSPRELSEVEKKMNHVHRYDLMTMYRSDATEAEYDSIGIHVESQWKAIEKMKEQARQEKLIKLKAEGK